MILTYIKKFWNLLNKISPTNRNFIIIILLGFLFQNQICTRMRKYLAEEIKLDIASNKKAEDYTKTAALEINRQVKLIAEKDQECCNVLLLSYHNSTQSLQGFKYLYLSCIAEAPKELDTPLLKPYWDKIDYIYYADELVKIHNQGFVHIRDLEEVRQTLPKLYRLVKASEAESVTFYAMEGHEAPIGMIVVLYKNQKLYNYKNQKDMVAPIQRIAILLDYGNMQK